MNRLADRVILVTGSTGIAAASAHRFAAEGGAVFVTSRTESHCRELADSISAAGGQVGFKAAELTDETQVGAAVAACVETFGRIDGVFSVAGGSGRRFGDGPIHEMTGESWDRTLELNLRSQALVCREVVLRLLDQAPTLVPDVIVIGGGMASSYDSLHAPPFAYERLWSLRTGSGS